MCKGVIKRPNYGPFDKEDDDEDLRFHGGKTKKYHRRNKRNTIKRHK